MSDRQLLLEQKRQRLQELRQRRLNSTPSPSNEKNAIEQNEQNESNAPTLKVEVGVQTVQKDAVLPVSQFKEVSKFDKGVQTVRRDQQSAKKVTNDTQIPHTPKVEDPIKVAQNVNEHQLNSSLRDAIIFLNEIMATQPVVDKDEGITTNKEQNAIYLVNQILPVKDSVPVIIHCSTNPHEFIVCFNGEQNQFQGFAIIYKLTSGKIVPINFLGSFSPITAIQFDQNDPQKVIGGLQNGKVVVWEIRDFSTEEAILLPTLTSPNDYTNKSLHKSPINSIHQLPSETNSFISTCGDGLINVWSTNFLEYPKFETIILPNDTDDGLGILSSKTKSISHALLVSDAETSLEDGSFLSSMIVSTDSGTIQQLVNDAKLGYVNGLINSKIVGTLTKLGQKDELPIIAATCYDSSIYVYNSHKEIMKLFTDYLVLGCFTKPNVQYQFISYGLFDELFDKPSTVIDFWDLNVDVRTPIHTLRINSTTHPISGQFDSKGDYFYLGFSDGKVGVFSINTEHEIIKDQETINDII